MPGGFDNLNEQSSKPPLAVCFLIENTNHRDNVTIIYISLLVQSTYHNPK